MSRRRLLNLLRDESGPTAVEYAVLVALIITVAISAIVAFGNSGSRNWQSNVQQLQGALGD